MLLASSGSSLIPSSLRTEAKNRLSALFSVLRKNLLRAFLEAIFVTQLLKILTKLIVLFRVFRFTAVSYVP